MQTSGIESPADEEEEEELLEQSSSDEEPPPVVPVPEEYQLPSNIENRPLQAEARPQQLEPLPQLSLATVPQQEADPLAAPLSEEMAESQQLLLKVRAPPAQHPQELARLPQVLLQQRAPPAPQRKELGRSQHIAPRQSLVLVKTNASLQMKMPAAWPPEDNSHQECDPPCIQGRGICNDKVCFCRSPFIGSTCQHKQSALYRAPKIMVVGFATVCVFCGIVLAKLVFSFSERAVETRLQRYGDSKRKFEKWQPPAEDQKGVLSSRKTEAGI